MSCRKDADEQGVGQHQDAPRHPRTQASSVPTMDEGGLYINQFCVKPNMEALDFPRFVYTVIKPRP